MKKLFKTYEGLLDKLTDLPPLFMRLMLAYGFYKPMTYKIKDFSGTADWFASLGMPFPLLNAYMAGITELLGVIFLVFGFKTRYIAFPLIITMLVAIFTVHIDNGFNAGKNGYEIPLYYIVMLFTLMVTGSGRYSLDHIIVKRMSSK